MDMSVKSFLLISGLTACSYYAYIKFKNRPKQSKKIPVIPLDLTRKVLQEIKHQMLIVCINFATGMQKHVASNLSKEKMNDEKISLYFRSEMTTIYEQKEKLIINKYDITKQCYGDSLNHHFHDKKIKANQNQILDMMQRAVKGIIPNLDVHSESHIFNRNELKQLYYNLCLKIATLVVLKLQKQKKINPAFNSKDDGCFRKAIRQLKIYDQKVQFLTNKGYQSKWGCPNEIFFKQIQHQKQLDIKYKQEVTVIQKGYQTIIQKVSDQPDSITINELPNMFKQKQEILSNFISDKGTQQISQKINKDIKLNKDLILNDNDLDDIMMKQLLTRSKQQPSSSVQSESVFSNQIKNHKQSQQEFISIEKSLTNQVELSNSQ